MMSKRNFYFLLLAGTVLSFPAWALSSPGRTDTHTHTRVSEPKPASQFAEPDKAYKTASVCFLGVGDCDPNVGFTAGDDYTVDTEKQCLNEGFSRLNCNTVQQGYGICPYNSAYGKGCKCISNLVSCPAGQVGVGDACNGKYASCRCSPSLVSCPSNKNGTGASCGGKYQGCSCKSEYVYTSSNCSYPRSLSGSSCDGRYTGCSCPSGVSSGAYGCAEYYPSPCSGICKRAKTDNCDIRSSVSTPYGCASYWSDCPSKCRTGYNDNCRNRTAVSAPYGCQRAWGDCQSKCQTAYPDNCRNRNAVAVPANAYCSATFSDCSSKCSAWRCNAGYKQSGNSCVVADPCAGVVAANCSTGYYCNSYNCGKCVSCAKCDSKFKYNSCILGYVSDGTYTTPEFGRCDSCGGLYAQRTCQDNAYVNSSGICEYDCSNFQRCMSNNNNNCSKCMSQAGTSWCARYCFKS